MSRHIRVGITHGDMNGIGYEVIIKALDDELMPELFTPVIFGSDKAMAFYRKTLGCGELRVRRVASAAEASDNAVNLVDVMTEDVKVNPGVPDEAAGRASLLALEAACDALEAGEIDALVTAPIDKNTIHGEGFDFPGHTEYLEAKFRSEEDADGGKALMILFNEMLRVALVTTHLPVSKIAEHITAASVTDTVERFDGSLRRDFRCERPRIAVLGLNPHCGDHGIAGDEDDTVIRPAVDALRERGIMAFGPYAADGFFGSGAQGAQQLKAQSVPPELLTHIDAHLGHAPVTPPGIYPVQSTPPCQHPAGKDDQTALLCVGSVPRGIGRAFGLEGGVFRSDALNIDSGDRAPVLRRHRPDDDLIHTFILGGPKIARILFPLPDKF